MVDVKRIWLALILPLWVLAFLTLIWAPPPNAVRIGDHISPVPFASVDGIYEGPIVGGGESTGESTYEYVGFVWSLELPAAPLPEAMAQKAYAVWWCESRMDDGAVGRAGERGVAQLHPIHAAEMERAGLDYDSGWDRLTWAIRLWERHGWGPWSCKP